MILVFDDERFYIKDYIQALRDAKYEVEHMRTLKDVLAMFEKELDRIELVIVDVMAFGVGNVIAGVDLNGGMTGGIWLIGELRRIEERREHGIVPTIVLTNRTGEMLKVAEGLPGVRRVLEKAKVYPWELVEAVRECARRCEG